MPVLTPEATKLLDKLTASKAVLIDKPRVMQVVGLSRELAGQLEEARFLNAAFFLVATGHLSGEAVLAHKGLTQQQRVDCLQLAEQYQDAQKYRDLQASEGQLKRYQAFAYEQYDCGAGGSNDIAAEADTLEALAEACPASVRAIDEVLDMHARKWLDAEALALLNERVSTLYAERNPPVQGPKLKSQIDYEESVLGALMFGRENLPLVGPHYIHEEKSLTSGLNSTSTPVQDESETNTSV